MDLHVELLAEFERLLKGGMKMSSAVLLLIAIYVVNSAPEGTSYKRAVRCRGNYIVQKGTLRWIQHFTYFHHIFLRV